MNEKEQAKKDLLKMFAGDIKKGKPPVIYTTVKHVSQRGMMRHIDINYIKNNKPIKLNWYIQRLGLFKRAKNYDSKNADSLRVSGCGMDMGFHVVYNLSSILYEDNFYCLGNDCLSNDHTNDRKPYQFEDKKGNYIKGKKHSSGSYLLNQEWL